MSISPLQTGASCPLVHFLHVSGVKVLKNSSVEMVEEQLVLHYGKNLTQVSVFDAAMTQNSNNF